MNTSKTIGITVIALVIGLLAGHMLWAAKPMSTHMMPDGSMMSSDGQDMSGMMHDMNAALEGKTGDAFDQEFLSEMIVHHQGAVDMAQLALANAKHPELKAFAQDIVSAQTKEIKQMKDWQTAWYK
jgi:uncharacterized protein (DUF305 family)